MNLSEKSKIKFNLKSQFICLLSLISINEPNDYAHRDIHEMAKEHTSFTLFRPHPIHSLREETISISVLSFWISFYDKILKR
jgi:hypothetical protein